MVMARSSTSDRKQNKTRRARKSRLAKATFEQLEKRELFVVGANFFPAEDLSFDGVVQILNVGVPGGSGVLLDSGRHVLTAAHCLDLQVDTDGNGQVDAGDRVVDSANFTIRFEVGGRDIDYTVPRANVSFPTGYTGSWFNNDIALITLPDLAPQGADRSAIYRSSDEVGKAFTIVGYGSTGAGKQIGLTAAGHDNSFGTKRSGANAFDSSSGTVLNYDLDDVVGEVIQAPGDSGGPSFINGRVAGISSGGTLLSRFNALGNLNYPGGSAIGATAFVTRVSQHAAWIDGIVGAAYDLVLDMNHHLAGNDGREDTIRVQRTGANIDLLINGQVVHTDASSNIRSIRLLGSGDKDVFDLSTQFAVTVDGRTGANSVVAPNQLNGWTITGSNRGRIGEWASFSNVGTIKGGADTDIFALERAGRVSGVVNGGAGLDVLDYSKWTSAVDVNLPSERATATGGVTAIENVKGGSGNDILVGDANANTLTGYGGHDILDGGDGDDSLFGGVGDDLLIGGRGTDRLDGDGDDDLLIGGRLSGDSAAIRREWIRTDNTYDARVANLRNGGGLNGSVRLTSSNVVDDGLADTLNGGAGIDWFWGTAAEVKDREYDYSRSLFELIN